MKKNDAEKRFLNGVKNGIRKGSFVFEDEATYEKLMESIEGPISIKRPLELPEGEEYIKYCFTKGVALAEAPHCKKSMELLDLARKGDEKAREELKNHFEDFIKYAVDLNLKEGVNVFSRTLYDAAKESLRNGIDGFIESNNSGSLIDLYASRVIDNGIVFFLIRQKNPDLYQNQSSQK